MSSLFTIISKLGGFIIRVRFREDIAQFSRSSGWIAFFIIISRILILHNTRMREGGREGGG